MSDDELIELLKIFMKLRDYKNDKTYRTSVQQIRGDFLRFLRINNYSITLAYRNFNNLKLKQNLIDLGYKNKPQGCKTNGGVIIWD